MLQSFVITLREGLEAFLIVAISLAYLKRTGRAHLASAVRWGIVISVVVSGAAGVLLSQARNQALWEGILALVAAVLVTTLIVHMWRSGRRMRQEIESRLASSAERTGAAAFGGVLGFTVLMITREITREGMETAMLMNTLLFQIQAPAIIAARSPERSWRPASPGSGRATASGSISRGSSRSPPSFCSSSWSSS
jgi:high-affinity iron transporter